MLPSLEEAIAAIKAGNKEKGRKLLADILQADLENETAWLWMSSVANSDEERRRYLKRVLEINPDNASAQRGLAMLKQKQAQAKPAAPPPSGGLSSRLGTEPPASPAPVPPPKAEEAPPPSPPASDEPTDLSLKDELLPPPAFRSAAKEPAQPTTPPPKSTADDLISELRGSPPPVVEEEPVEEEPPDEKPSKKADPKGNGVINFLNSERGVFTLIAATVAIVLALAACVVLNLVFQPLAQQLSPTVAAVLGTDTPTATFTPSVTSSPTSTETPTATPTLTPSPLSTRVVFDTPTVTPTLTRTPTPDRTRQNGQVIGVTSGDTITVLLDGQEVAVKYLGIDAPAVNDPNLGTEPLGEEALAANRILVEGKQVRLEIDVTNTDESGRLLRYVFVDDQMVNEILLRQGAARLILTPPDIKYGAQLEAAEQDARARGIGIWGLQ
ncbi:MAG: thermonuclease family protein [Anaerolineae bacterium]|nr:thermonuclease family protein [Anaerolineae bacterium]